MTETPILTQIFKSIQLDLANILEKLKPASLSVLTLFFGIELFISIMNSNPSQSQLKTIILKTRTWAYLSLMIFYFDKINSFFQKIFGFFLKKATGGQAFSQEIITSLPYRIINAGFSSIKSIISNISLTEPKSYILLFGVIIALFIFAKISLSIGMVVIEYMVMSTISIILLPFMMFEKLRFVGDKVIGTLINLNLKIITIQFLLYCFGKFLSKPISKGDGDITSIIAHSFYWLVAMAIIGLMTGKGSEMAQTLISGATTFGDSSELVGMARTGLSNLEKMVAGAITGKSVAGGMVSGAISGARDGGSSMGKFGPQGQTIGAVVGGLLGGIKGGMKKK